MPAVRRYLLALVAVFLLAACERAPTLSRLSPHDVILAFGDSLTHGTGASEDTAYPAVLASLTGRTVINAGVPGDTTTSALRRLPEVLAEYRPRLVLLCLGGNDMLGKQPESTTENNLRLLIQTIRASGAEVVLIGVPEPKLFGGAPDFYARVARDMRLPLEDEVFNEVLKDNRLKSDPIHANAAGYRVVAERLAEFLRKAGAL
ncbi:MAG: arylesterase [Thiobacillus sp. 63-78]|uniref:arylesterase n=1 Tax=Thiobacillus sp. 63-78 TaxID=1895859 RepID=UPI0009632E84|nr:arylesterase [Thiobacillus sp. 63-78]MBN8764206.1 arylesterase [Thiobacillus sp.]MBN8772978.1 arylesterase [Thiobacillus sp.]OJZ06599.1 MAG: arylesterase [Thiobacillus sp. 63-78]